MRTILAVIAGFFLAALIAYGVEYINHFFWFPPEVNWFDPQEVMAFVPNLPAYAALPNLIGGILGVYLGTRWAGHIARTGSYLPGIGVIALVILQGIAVQIIAPQEWWVLAISAAAVLIAGYYGTRGGAKSK